MNDPKRQEIKNRIAASQARNEARVPFASKGSEESGVIGFIKEHPIATIAGGVALGVLVAGMFPSARKAAKKGGARASALSVIGTQAALAAFQHLLDSAEEARRSGSEHLDDLGDRIGDAARGLRHEAHHLADRSADGARMARSSGRSAARSLKGWWS